MKATELRIGNLVERDGNLLEVIRIAKDGIINYDLVSKSQGMHVNSGNVIPIPLTEEWLLKFGFFKRNGENRFELKNIGVVLLENNCCVDMYDSYNEIISPLTLIKYVHQLQNLYFALTGAELTVA